MDLLNDHWVYEKCDIGKQYKTVTPAKTFNNNIHTSLKKLKDLDADDSPILPTWANKQLPHIMPTGNVNPPARFYGLPKIHKQNIPLHFIVSACGTSSYNLACFLTNIL